MNEPDTVDIVGMDQLPIEGETRAQRKRREKARAGYKNMLVTRLLFSMFTQWSDICSTMMTRRLL